VSGSYNQEETCLRFGQAKDRIHALVKDFDCISPIFIFLVTLGLKPTETTIRKGIRYN
jgi:hypothetical protein